MLWGKYRRLFIGHPPPIQDRGPVLPYPDKTNVSRRQKFLSSKFNELLHMVWLTDLAWFSVNDVDGGCQNVPKAKVSFIWFGALILSFCYIFLFVVKTDSNWSLVNRLFLHNSELKMKKRIFSHIFLFKNRRTQVSCPCKSLTFYFRSTSGSLPAHFQSSWAP